MFGFFARNEVDEHRLMPHFISAVMGDALRHGEVDSITRGDRVVATASWIAPGDIPRSRRREALISMRCARALVRGRNRIRGLRLLDEMAKQHPAEPHWYLVLLGVDPAFQGAGLGTSLLNHRLAAFDTSHMPTYLETQKPENVPYYERFGFTVRAVIQLPGCPPLWTMWRDPR